MTNPASRIAHVSAGSRGEPVISVRGLRKSYGEREVVRGIDLEVHAGEIFAFLGPNGAGKTVTVEILEGYRSRDAGEVSVLGEDPPGAGREWRSRIGVVLQSCTMPGELTVGELLELYASYYPQPRPVEETIELVGLRGSPRLASEARSPAASSAAWTSALALIGDPELVFLDEPTTGFDPVRASSRLGGDREPPRPRQDGLPHHPLHGGGTGAGRPRRGDRRRAGSSPRARRRRSAAATRPPSDISFTPPPGLSSLHCRPSSPSAPKLRDGRIHLQSEHPARTLHDLGGWALEHGCELTT